MRRGRAGSPESRRRCLPDDARRLCRTLGIALPILLLTVLPGCGVDADSAGATAETSAFSEADGLRQDGRYAEAAARYRVLRDSFAALGDTAALWRAELWEAKMRLEMGQPDSARTQLSRARRLVDGNPEREGWTRWVASSLHDRRGEFEEALREAEATLEIAERLENRNLRSVAINALGRIHSLTGRYRQALAVHERDLEFQREHGTSGILLAQALNELGIDYRNLGRFDDAVRVYEEALRMERERGDLEGIARVSYNLARVHLSTGDHPEARRLLTRSLRDAEEVGEIRGQGLIHGALGDLYLRVGNPGRARRHLERALEINREARLTYGEVVALENLGRAALARGDPERANERLVAALSVADSAGYGKERATVRTALALAAADRGDGELAVSRARTAVTIADSVGDPGVRYEAREALGTALETAARTESALEAYLSGIALLESWRGRLTLGDLRLGVSAPRHGSYEGAIRTLVALDRPTEAFEMAERARARLLLELMADREGDGAETPRARLRRRLREAFAERSGADPTRRPELDREIEELTTALERLADEARAHDPGTAAARYPSPASLPVLQEELLSPDHALLVFFWGERDVYGWWIGEDSVRVARLGDPEALSGPVAFLRHALEAPGGPGWRRPARRVYRDLLAPLRPSREDRVLVIPDGPLAHLPFGVLVPSGGNGSEGRPWGAGRRITYGPSASVLLALAARPRDAPKERALLAVGNPGDRERGAPDPASAPLPFAAEEAREIAGMFEEDGADVLLASDATLERWIALEPARYRYLHFAAHVRVDDRRPGRTHVVLAGDRLPLATIRELDLPASLVTLSACESALGRRVRGEGIIGLPHAFLAAGARRALVSLWRVRDRAAKEFMVDFYRELRAAESPSEALRRVRRAYTETGGVAAHPSRWAAFVLVGAS